MKPGLLLSGAEIILDRILPTLRALAFPCRWCANHDANNSSVLPHWFYPSSLAVTKGHLGNHQEISVECELGWRKYSMSTHAGIACRMSGL